ncbi:MAG: hypothetical protein ACE5F1_15405 [Planctomycetota bacterium]
MFDHLAQLMLALSTIQENVEPWFDPNRFGAWYGSVAGGGGGVIGGTLGALGGWLAPKGKGRSFVIGGMFCMLVFGLANLAFGITALVLGQPYGIWYGGLLCGVIFTAVTASLIPVMNKRYRQAEQRRMEAEDLRRS